MRIINEKNKILNGLKEKRHKFTIIKNEQKHLQKSKLKKYQLKKINL